MRCVFVTEEIFFRIFDAMNDMVIAVQLLSPWHFLLNETGYAERPKKRTGCPTRKPVLYLVIFSVSVLDTLPKYLA